jgi:outer membrane receptor protein involved in Fe transport
MNIAIEALKKSRRDAERHPSQLAGHTAFNSVRYPVSDFIGVLAEGFRAESHTGSISLPGKRALVKLLGPLLVFFAALSACYAQSGAGTLQGTVTDPSGAEVPGANVVVTSETTGVERQLTSNSAGLYVAADLPAGRYRVVASASGFSKQRIDNVELTVGAVRNLDVQLKLGSVENVVNVTITPATIDTATSTVQGIVSGPQTRDLPLNGRDFTALAALQPGVSAVLTQFTSNATSTTRLSRGLGSQLTIGGNRPQLNSYRLDGVNINDYANGSPGSVSGALLGVDAVQEFSVIMSNAPAQYGRTAGGVVNSVTRSGTNTFHGAAYDFIRNSVFDARNYFDPQSGVPSFRRNQFGASAGGPIIKARTFFFANYEGFRQSLGQSLTAIVLSPNARKGQLVCTSGATCVNGLTKVTIDPKVVPYLALYNQPNGALHGDTADYNFNTQQPTNEDFFTFHLDHTFSSKDSLRGTGLYDTSSVNSSDASNAVNDAALSRRTTVSLEEVHVFGSQFTNAARFGYSRSAATAPIQRSVINPAAADTKLGFFPGDTVGSLIVSGLQTFNGGVGAVGTFSYHYNSYQVYDDASLIRGRQSISFGGTVERIQSNQLAGLLPNGSWSFGSIRNFLTNTPTFFESGLPITPVRPFDLRSTIAAGYVQDDWRFRPNLTLNLGLRYEMNTNITEASNRLGKLVNITDPAASPVHTYFTNNPTLKNFEPRVGFSWDPFSHGTTVIRGAFGIYDVLPLPYILALQGVSSAPAYDEGRVVNEPKGSFPLNGFATTGPKVRAIYTPDEAKRNYKMQYTFNIQHQLSHNLSVTLGYIGSHGVHDLFNTNDINIVLPVLKSPQGYVFPKLGTGVPQNPNLGTVSGTYFKGSSLYNALQTTLNLQSTRLTGQLSYTWSKSIDDSSSSISGASFNNAVASPPFFDLRLSRGPSDFDVRHVFTANSILALPSPGPSFGKWAEPLRGWTFTNIILVRTGIPFTPIVGGDPLGLLTNAPFAFPDRVNNGNCTHGHSVNYLNTACFAFPGTFEYTPGLSGPLLGNSGRNSIYGPGLFNWTTGLIKEIHATERLRVQLQAQAFNVTNHTNFANPQSTQLQVFNASGALLPTAGQLTLTSTTSRQLQFALKVLF